MKSILFTNIILSVFHVQKVLSKKAFLTFIKSGRICFRRLYSQKLNDNMDFIDINAIEFTY